MSFSSSCESGSALRTNANSSRRLFWTSVSLATFAPFSAERMALKIVLALDAVLPRVALV